MGANLALAYIPAAKITKQRRRVLHRLVDDLSDVELNSEEIVALSDEHDVRQMLHEHVDLLPVNSELHRDVAEFALPHMPYRVSFTGGSSWGDSPCELFDSYCSLGALPTVLRQLRDWAITDEQLRRSRISSRKSV